MSRSLPDLWDSCYEGEHRRIKSPEQFKNEFCSACMNVGCRNSRGAGTKWNQRIISQEDRLLNNPQFAPEDAAITLGLPDFKNMIQEALRVEISTQRNDWEPVSDADVGRAAAEMLGIVQPSVAKPKGFEPEVPPEEPPEPEETREKLGQWKVKGDSVDERGNRRTYVVTQYQDGEWSCTCPSRENPCKHSRGIQNRLSPQPKEPDSPRPDPVVPKPAPRSSFPTSMNTPAPDGGVMIGGGPPPAPKPPVDPWEPTAPKVKKIEVGGRVKFKGK
jgi:hypothetical protein